MVEGAADGAHKLGSGWLVAAAVVVALALFTAFLIGSFPYNDTASAILAPFRLRLTYQAQHPRLPFGVRLEDASLIAIVAGSTHPLVHSPEIILTPALSALFFGQPGLNISAELYAGEIAATLHKQADTIKVAFSVDDLNLTQCTPLQQLGATFGGNLSGAGSAVIRGPAIGDDGGAATLAGHDLTLEITHGFPLIHLGLMSGRILLSDGILTFQEIETHGSDLEARIDGVIRLAPDLNQSTIAARVSLTPTSNGRAHFGLFLKMLPHPPAEGPYYLHGPLYSPSIT